MANAAIVGGLIGATNGTEAITKDHLAQMNGFLNPNKSIQYERPLEYQPRSVMSLNNISVIDSMIKKTPTTLTVIWDS